MKTQTFTLALFACLFLGSMACFAQDEMPFQHKVDVYRSADGDAVAFTVRLEQAFLAEEFEKSNFPRLRSDDERAWLIYPQQTKFEQKHAEFFGRLRGEGTVKLRLSYDTVLENLDGTRRVEAKEEIIEVEIPKVASEDHNKAIGPQQIFKDWANQQNLHFARMLRYYPDETFFQYVLLQSKARYGVTPPPIPGRTRSASETETDLYEVFTGSLAIQQSLQRETLSGKLSIASYVMVPGRENTAELLRLIPGVPEVVENDPTLTDLSWIGDRVSIHFCDGDSILEIDPTLIKPLSLPMIGETSTETQAIVAAVFMMANMPVYATVDVENRDKAERMIEQFAEQIFLQQGNILGFDTKLDAYQLPDYKDHDIYVLNMSLYAISLRLHISLVGDQLVLATKPGVLREVIDASTADIDPNAKMAHMLIRLDHRALDRLSDDVQLYWAEKSRVSCHRNVISIYNFHELYGAPIDKITELSEAKYGVRYYCPDHGDYSFDKELNQVVCSVHGNREHSHQQSRLDTNSSFSKFIESLDTITASIVFVDDALLATVEIERGNHVDEEKFWQWSSHYPTRGPATGRIFAERKAMWPYTP